MLRLDQVKTVDRLGPCATAMRRVPHSPLHVASPT